MTKLSDYVKPHDYHPLSEIDGKLVTLESWVVSVDTTDPKKPKYHSIVLVDGINYHCWSTLVGQTLQEAPLGAPLEATFVLVKTATKAYWTIE